MQDRETAMDRSRTPEVKILVSAGSKHGATAEIAERIGNVLRERGFAATVANPKDAIDLSEYDAFVLGSAVYAGHWLDNAKNLAERVAGCDPELGTWLFSSGPIGDPPKPEEEPVDVADIVAATSARDHRVLSGKIDKSKLSFAEKAILIAVRSPEGDFRDWTEIEAWAGCIADTINAETTDLGAASTRSR